MKKVAFKIPQRAKPAADRWVEGGGNEALLPAPAEPTGPMKRFTIDVPLELHTRIKTQCAMQGVKMADILREVLEKQFPQSKA